MRILKLILKWILYILLLPVTYIVVSLALTFMTVDRIDTNEKPEKTLYLSTNGVHLDIILPKENMDSSLLSGIKQYETDHYLSFGWGDENFYLNTPTWADLTISNAFRAMFLKSSTLMHVTRYTQKQADWVEIKVSDTELKNMNQYLLEAFSTNEKGMKIMLNDKGYSSIDDFYTAKGNYSCFNTCNSWANTGFKKSGMKSCLWTPFDFGLINKYK